MAIKIPVADDTSEEAVQALVDAFDDASQGLIGRKDVFDLILVALITKSHILLNGGPGLGKSMIADAAFSAFEPDTARIYTKMMMAGTLPEEVFGPMNMKVFRERAEVTFNTDGMLPTADFAFIDEVYRAPDSILGACLNIFNERRFVNGPVVQKCPLNTVVGTTNFISDAPILEAFQDRWLFTFDVLPLDTVADRLAMLKLVYDPPKSRPRRVSMKDLRAVQKAVASSPFDREIADLYEKVVSKFRLAVGNRFLSDRRYAQGFQIVRAGAILNPDDLASMFARLRHVFPKDEKEINSFDSIFQTEIQTVATAQKEKPRIEEFEKVAIAIRRNFDPKIKTSKLREILDSVDSLIASEDSDDTISPLDVVVTFTTPEYSKRYEKSVEILKSVRLSVIAELDKRSEKITERSSSPKSSGSKATVDELDAIFNHKPD